MSRLEKILLTANIILYGFLTVFSYAYVDLNLTLSQNPQSLFFVKLMQQLGYYHRPQATLIYLSWIGIAFSFFIFNLWSLYKNKIGLGYLKISAITNTLILILAYPFLSSDLFNYLFDAKLILNYQASPYTYRPLDFPNDEWLRFMRWVHRLSPYGPLWLGMSIIPAFLGFGKFILNFLTFKIFIASFHLINTYLIFLILKRINLKIAAFGTAFYALNPLFLIEGVANAHNDVVLATFMLGSLHFFAMGKNLRSFLILLAGVLIKYIPILNLPWLLLAILNPKIPNCVKMVDKKHSIIRLIILNLVTMAIFTYVYSSFRITVPFVSSGATQVQFQPWYLFWTLPFVALLPSMGLMMISIALSVGASLRYLPYLYYGDWDHEGTLLFMELAILIPLLLLSATYVVKRVIKH